MKSKPFTQHQTVRGKLSQSLKGSAFKTSGLHWTTFTLVPNSRRIRSVVRPHLESQLAPSPLPGCSLTFQAWCEPSKPQLANEVPETSTKAVSKGQPDRSKCDHVGT